MRRDVLSYDLKNHPEKESINMLRADFYSNRIELHTLRENLKNISKEEKRQSVHYIFALEESLKLKEKEIRQKIQSHLPTLYQPFFENNVKISNI